MAMLQADELAAHLRLRRCIVKSTAASPATNVVETQRGKQGPTATVNIMTWNILADCYVRVKNQPWNAFAHCADEHLSWAARRPKIERILAATMADVIALQEVVFEERTGIPEMNEEHEQACFWRAPAWLVHLAHKNGLSVELQKLSQKEFNKNALRNERESIGGLRLAWSRSTNRPGSCWRAASIVLDLGVYCTSVTKRAIMQDLALEIFI